MDSSPKKTNSPTKTPTSPTKSPSKTSTLTKTSIVSPQKAPVKSGSSSPKKTDSQANSPKKIDSQPTSPQKQVTSPQKVTSPKSGSSSPKKIDSQANSPKKIDSQPTSPLKQGVSPKSPRSPQSGGQSPFKRESESPIKPTPVEKTESPEKEKIESPIKPDPVEKTESPEKEKKASAKSEAESPVKQSSEVAEPQSPQVDEQIQAHVPIPILDNVPKTSILIVAANGKLGSAITRHCLARKDILVNILIRNVEKEKQLADSVRVKGGKVFEGDVTQPETLDEPTKRVHTVISCVNSFDEKIAVDGQNNLLQANQDSHDEQNSLIAGTSHSKMVKNGVRRFVPSDFGVNYTKFTKEELERTSIVSPKIKFQELLDKTYIIQLHFYQGMIMEMYFQLQAQGFSYWGDDNFKLELTCYDDIAKAVAVVVSEPYLAGTITYVGQRLTNREIGEIYSRVRGEKKEPHKNGEIDDLKIAYEEKREEGVFDAEVLGLYLLTTDERSLFNKDNNDALPTVPSTTVEEFLKKHPDVKLP